LLFGGAMALLMASAIVFFCVAAYRRDKERLALLRSVAVRPIADARDGYAWIKGQVEGEAKYTSPLSGEPRLFTSWTLEIKRSDRGWEVVGRGGDGTDIEVRDASGRARVSARDAALYVHDDQEEWSTWTTVPEPIRALVDGKAYYGLMGVRFQEAYIEPGATLHVFGRVVLEADHEVAAGYRDIGTSPVFRQQGKRDPFYVSTRGSEGVEKYYSSGAKFYTTVMVLFALPLAALGAYYVASGLGLF
jgi:hypothetical protein